VKYVELAKLTVGMFTFLLLSLC